MYPVGVTENSVPAKEGIIIVWWTREELIIIDMADRGQGVSECLREIQVRAPGHTTFNVEVADFACLQKKVSRLGSVFMRDGGVSCGLDVERGDHPSIETGVFLFPH